MSRGPVVFDGAILGAGPLTGVARSFLTTLHAYAELADRRCVVLLPEVAPRGLTEVEELGVPSGPIARRRALPPLLRELRADLLHSPVAALPANAPCPMIATIHDVPWLVRPRLREAGCRWRHRLAARWAARRAAAIITPSQASRDDIVRALGAPLAGRLRVVPHGVHVPQPTETQSRAAGEPDADEPFFLVLGDDRPRKNLDTVLAAYAIALRQDPDLPMLRRVGPPRDYVDEPHKWELLRRARGLLHLSLLEGFGLPVVEAFAAGTPVLCSRAGSLAEVAGDAALCTDPRDRVAIAAAIVRLHRDDALRAELRRRGLARAAAFRPNAAARAWRALHDEVAS